MENMELYLKGKEVPAEAKKPIEAGRLKGMTDINPMWRIKRLTEMFGPCGLGWWYVIKEKRLEPADNEIKAFVDIDLYYKYNGETSMAVPGTGGSSFLAMERNGAYVSDECFKMALTDAISVAAKSIGVGADVYYAKDRDKYTAQEEEPKKETKKDEPKATEPKFPAPAADGYWYCEDCKETVSAVQKKDGTRALPKEVVTMAFKRTGKCLCADCLKKYAT